MTKYVNPGGTMSKAGQNQTDENQDVEIRKLLHGYGPALIFWIAYLIAYLIFKGFGTWFLIPSYLLLAWLFIVQLRSFQLLIRLHKNRVFPGIPLRINLLFSTAGIATTIYILLGIYFQLPLVWMAIILSATSTLFVNGFFPNLRDSELRQGGN